ncbi:MAG: hypothetical protein OMM_15341 [Candidatus Magnetoglobus multicellularis str. Araruama]|uniref:Tyr recombinase domain-containing protein n=1 Tax=Candidatus Magnetoglobus multicellularis str. Araruama TaxID=890399 RepID=A0A1V1NQD3_9BACT|nr:MAG: hypothetical protein OMM_15341 [Candidatus Magnetoglobus multicellularis str. Araruama]
MFPKALHSDLELQVQKVRILHQRDIAEGYGGVWLPDALDKKFPNASTEFKWQYLFPSSKRAIDPRSGIISRQHIQQDSLQKAIKRATLNLNFNKRVSCHTFRNC